MKFSPMFFVFCALWTAFDAKNAVAGDWIFRGRCNHAFLPSCGTIDQSHGCVQWSSVPCYSPMGYGGAGDSVVEIQQLRNAVLNLESRVRKLESERIASPQPAPASK